MSNIIVDNQTEPISIVVDNADTTIGVIVEGGTGPPGPPGDIENVQGVSGMWAGTQAQYDAISPKNPTTLYIVI